MNSAPIAMEKYMEWGKFVPPAYSCLLCSYNDEIEQRVDYWYSVVNKIIPEINLPRYAITEQCFIDKFEAAAKKHNTPVRSEDAWAIQWYTGSFDGLFKATPHLAKALANSPAVNCPKPPEPSDPFNGLNRKQAAALALDNPDTLYNGLPAILNVRAGIKALQQAANQREDGWQILYMSSSSAHNRGVDWSKFRSQIRTNLLAHNLDRRFFGVGILSVLNDTNRSTCKKINHLYSEIDSSALSERQVKFLVNTITPSPSYISECATGSLPLLQALLNDARVADLAAARLYQIASAKEAATSGNFSASISSRRAILSNRKAKAEDVIRMRSREALNTVSQVGQGSFLSQRAKEAMNAEIEYWSARALQDFSDAQQGTQDDRSTLAELERRLQSALDSKKLSLASGIASTLGTYTANDKPSDTLISLLTLAVNNPDNQGIKMELEYALHQLGVWN